MSLTLMWISSSSSADSSVSITKSHDKSSNPSSDSLSQPGETGKRQTAVSQHVCAHVRGGGFVFQL